MFEFLERLNKSEGESVIEDWSSIAWAGPCDTAHKRARARLVSYKSHFLQTLDFDVT